MKLTHFKTLQQLADALKTMLHAPIVAHYMTNAGQSISDTTTTVIDYEDEKIDTHDLVSRIGGAWKFTANEAGIYAVRASILFDSTTNWAVGERAEFTLYKNASLEDILDYKNHFDTSGGAAYMFLGGATVIQLQVSDYLEIKIAQTTGSALAIYSGGSANKYNAVRIWKISS